jgi:hypothetical protein
MKNLAEQVVLLAKEEKEENANYDLKELKLPDSVEESLYFDSIKYYPACPRAYSQGIFTFLEGSFFPYSTPTWNSEDNNSSYSTSDEMEEVINYNEF